MQNKPTAAKALTAEQRARIETRYTWSLRKTDDMTDEEIARIKDAIKQTDAIFALEGFEPTEQTRAIDAAVLAGRVTRTRVVEEMRDYAMQYKTTDGFIQSRVWA